MPAGWARSRCGEHRTAVDGFLLAALVIVPRLILLASLENPEPRYTMEFFPVITALGGCGCP